MFRFSAGSPNGPLNPKTLTARSTGLGSAEGGKVARSSRPPIPILESKLAANATQGIAKEASREKISAHKTSPPHHPPPDIIKVRSAFTRGGPLAANAFCSGLPIRHDPPLRRVFTETGLT